MTTITLIIIPLTDDAGNQRDFYTRADSGIKALRRLTQFMEKHALTFGGDIHCFQQPSFIESLDMAREYGVTGEDARCINRYDGASDAEPMAAGWKIRPYYGQE